VQRHAPGRRLSPDVLASALGEPRHAAQARAACDRVELAPAIAQRQHLARECIDVPHREPSLQAAEPAQRGGNGHDQPDGLMDPHRDRLAAALA